MQYKENIGDTERLLVIFAQHDMDKKYALIFWVYFGFCREEGLKSRSLIKAKAEKHIHRFVAEKAKLPLLVVVWDLEEWEEE